MIKELVLVKRYADALAAFLKEGVGLDKGLQDLSNLKNFVIRNNPGFLELLDRPEIGFADKCVFIDNALGGNFSEEIKRFIKLLIENGRIDRLVDIADYTIERYSHEDELKAYVSTAFPLDAKSRESIKDKLENIYQRKFRLDVRSDPALLGGVRLVIGSRVIDGSIKGNLEALKERLLPIRI